MTERKTETVGENAAWEERNAAYLRAALDWLRLRIDRVLPSPEPQPTGRPTPGESHPVAAPAKPADFPRWGGFWRRGATAPPPAATTPRPPRPRPAGTEGSAEAAIEMAAERMAATVGDPPPALLVLQRRLGLSRFEREVLLLAAAGEFDTSFGSLYAMAQRDPTRRQASFALAMAVFDDPRWEAMAPHRPLRRLGLVDIDPSDSTVAARLRPAERVVNFIKGLSHLDPRLTALQAPFDTDQHLAPTPSQLPAVEEIVRLAGQPAPDHVVNLVGPDGPSKQLVAAAAATRLGLHLVRVPAADLPTDGAELAALTRLIEREALLSPVVVYLDAGEASENGSSGPGPVDRLLAQPSGLLLLDSRDPWPHLPYRSALIDVARPTTTEQRAAWEELLGEPATAAATAAEFDLDLATIHAVIDGLDHTSVGEGAPSKTKAVRHACRARCRPRLGLLAQRLTPTATWDDLVLPAEIEEQLEQLEQQVRFRSTVHNDWGMAQQSSRGLGLTALFAGEPGVGKTLCAEVLAARLDLDLHRIDLSGMVSKYIGETEKNLGAVFDAVDRGGSILFFDEADALFGKRSEVRDSHDRFANTQVAYLLGRMETHRGLVILATNMKRDLDEAFSRRLQCVVDIPFPGEAERARIWERAFPPGAPLESIDPQRLARLTLPGGAIRNVAVNATFMAAAATPQAVTMPMVLAAARREYRKLGLPASAADFSWDGPAEPKLARVGDGGVA